jgi:hypothetical protein
MIYRYIFFLFFIIICQTGFTQIDTINNDKLSIVAGIYGSYIWDNQPNLLYSGNPMYNEVTLGSRLLVFPFKELGGGIQFTKVYTTSIFNSLENFTLYGPIIQYKSINKERINFYADIGFLKGNFCLCEVVPVKKERLNYLSIGAGIYYRILPQIFLDIGFSSVNILNKMDYKFGYNHYRIGLFIMKPSQRKNSKSKNARYL